MNSYYYSRWFGVWGWASWRDRWAQYDPSPSILTQSIPFPYTPLFNYYCNRIFKKIPKANTWDYQFVYLMFKHKGYCLRPTRSLVENLGNTSDATHTSGNKFISRVRLLSFHIHPALSLLLPP